MTPGTKGEWVRPEGDAGERKSREGLRTQGEMKCPAGEKADASDADIQKWTIHCRHTCAYVTIHPIFSSPSVKLSNPKYSSCSSASSFVRLIGLYSSSCTNRRDQPVADFGHCMPPYIVLDPRSRALRARNSSAGPESSTITQNSAGKVPCRQRPLPAQTRV